MKSVLIVIHDMALGGAQKSLVSFLRCMEGSARRQEYDIDLIVVKPEGPFLAQIPDFVHLVEPSRPLLWLGTKGFSSQLKRKFCLRGVYGKLKAGVLCKLKRNKSNLNNRQMMWKAWKNLIPPCTKHYDIAVSYMHGFSNYYVMDKVSADRKVLWVHNEYQKMAFNAGFDAPYYAGCDRICTISVQCIKSFAQVFPQLSEKLLLLENITVRADILRMGEQGSASEFEGTTGLKIVSIGRLTNAKGYDMAIEAARQIKQQGLDFLWLVIGTGEERDALTLQAEDAQLGDRFRMIGTRENPYVYLKACDLFVQPSRFEGKSIALDEAKTFCKPIVVTNYTTAHDSLSDGRNGLIVDMDAGSVAAGILRIAQDAELRETLTANLRADTVGNESELSKYLDEMLS